MTSYSRRQINDLLILYLYQERKDGNDGYVEITAPIRTIDASISFSEAIEFAKYQENLGNIDVMARLEKVFGQITHKGMLYAEGLVEEGKKYLNFINEIRRKLKNQAKKEAEAARNKKAKNDTKFFSPKLANERTFVINTLKKIKRKIDDSEHIGANLFDLNCDLDILLIEFKKVQPDYESILRKLEMALEQRNILEVDMFMLAEIRDIVRYTRNKSVHNLSGY